MTAFRSRAAPPALRFGLSTLASLLLHAAALWPPGLARPQPAAPPARPALEAVLLAPALSTREEPPAAAAPPSPPPATVPPAPTFSRQAPPPRELKGRALDAAMAALARQDFYPREAVERGLEGDVIVLLTLGADGTVAEASVATGSGHPLLDAAALAAVRRIGRLPGARPQVLLPVRFRLD